MAPGWLEAILDWISRHPGLAGVAIGFVTFMEGLALIGIIIPGIIILFGFGALVGLGVLDLATLWIWSSAGAMLGDGASFWIGHHYRDSLRGMWPFSRFQDLIDRGVLFFRRHGLKSVIIGRFVGPVRPIMPVVAGMMSMPLKRYIPANIIAAVFWAPAYFLPGVVFGASIELAKAVALRLALLLLVLGALVFGLTFVVSRVYAFLAPQTSRMLAATLAWSSRHPLLGRPARSLVDPSRPESGTLLLFAVFVAAATWGLATILVADAIISAPFVMDQATFDAMLRLRSPWADQLMVAIFALGDDSVLLPAAAVLFAWLLFRHRRHAAAHWGMAVGFGWLLAVLFDQLMTAAGAPLPRSSEDFPQARVAMSVAAYGFFAILIARELPGRRRMWPYVTAAVTISLVMFSHVYFGLGWATHVMAGAFLGLVWIAILGMLYRTRTRRSFWMAPPAAIFYVAVLGSAAYFVVHRGDAIAETLKPPVKQQTLAVSQWWKGQWTPAPGAPFPINFEYAGELEALTLDLQKEGWSVPPPAQWGIVFQMMQPNPTAATLPLLPAAYQGRSEALVLCNADPGDSVQHVLRVWSSGASLEDGRELWVGSLATYEQKRVSWFFTYWSQTDRSGALGRLMLSPSMQTRRLEDGPRSRLKIRMLPGAANDEG